MWDMQEEGIRFNNYVFFSVLKVCGYFFEWRISKEVYVLILRSLFEYDVFVSSVFIDMYFRCGFIENARRVFNSMIEKDLVVLNAMIVGYV